jgi:hypothetical protein
MRIIGDTETLERALAIALTSEEQTQESPDTCRNTLLDAVDAVDAARES